MDLQDSATTFVDAALGDRMQAEALLATHPEVAQAGLHAALVLGNWQVVEEILRHDPHLVTAKGGPRDWEPLLYVCFSQLTGRTDGLVATARVLLQHGADPNASYVTPKWPESPLPCLYGASGLNNNPGLARVLLEGGADPNDGESLYHSTEHPDLVCVRLLLQYGASPGATNVLNHMLDREDPEGVRLLLQAGANPDAPNHNGETALHWAVRRRRSLQIVSMLLNYGAKLNIRRKDGRTAYALAVQSGCTEIAALLAERGADTQLSQMDAFLLACETADESELSTLLSTAPAQDHSQEDERLLPDLAMNHRVRGVRALLAAGFPVHAKGELGATALHWSCWQGYADLIQILLPQGAPLDARDDQYQAIPAGWFTHGLANCRCNRGDYVAAARELLAAGAEMPPCDVPTGDPGVDAVLLEHGIINALPH